MPAPHARRGLAAIALALATLVAGCDKNPVDAAIEAAIDFEGYFRADDGTEIELSGTSAYVRKMGSATLGTDLGVGDPYMLHMFPTDVPGEFRGHVIDRSGLLGWGNVRLDEGSLTVTQREGTAPTGQTNWQRTTRPSTPPPSGGGGQNPPPPGGGGQNPPPPTSGVTTLVSVTGLEGAERSRRYWAIQVPAGTKQLRVTTTEDNQWGGNLGDLFVRHGSQPTASHHPYVWTATRASVESNRADEVIVIANPPAGTWHILLYGYHAYWGTTLTATITR